ncbi:MAG TPA: CHAT domain-containing protein [Thermoanaerobaculia bacterium]|nr:CHAT domain-containing protein [Thermoanaerobaculia bacterium]
MTHWRSAVTSALLILGTLVACPAASSPFTPIPAYSPELQALREAAALKQDGERLQEEGRAEEAREKWLAAVEAYRRAGYPLGEIEVLFLVGASYQSNLLTGPEAMLHAADYFRQGMVAAGNFMSEVAGSVDPANHGPLQEPHELLHRASGLAASGKCSDALPLFVEAGKKYGLAGSPLGELSSLAGRLRCLPPVNDPLAAMEILGTVLEFQRIGSALQGKVDAGPRMRYLRAIEDREFGRWITAEALLRGALGEFERAGDPWQAALVALDLGGLLATRGKAEQAEVLYGRADQLLGEVRNTDALRNQLAARKNLINLPLSAAPKASTWTPQAPAAELPVSSADTSDSVVPVAGLSPRAAYRRSATFLLGDGDRLYRSGRMKEARAKWLAAAEAYEQAKDSMGLADTYERLASVSVPGNFSHEGPPPNYMDYITRAMAARLDFLESFARKRRRVSENTLAEADQLFSEADSLIRSATCEKGLPLLKNVRALYQRAGFPAGELRSLLLRLRCLADSDDALGALTTFMEMPPLLQVLSNDDPEDELELSSQRLASGYRLLEAKAHYEELLCQSEREKDPEAIARHLLKLTRMQLELGEVEEAEISLQRSLGLLPFVDEEEGEVRAAEAHEILGSIRFAQGKEEDGIEEFGRARGLIWRSGDPEREAVSLFRLAIALADSDDSARALSFLAEAESLRSRLPVDPEAEGDLLATRGSIQFFQGKLQEALGSFYEAEKLYAESGSPLRNNLVFEFISGIHSLLGRDGNRSLAGRQGQGAEKPVGFEFIEGVEDLHQLWILFQARRFEDAAILARKSLSFWIESGNQGAEALMRIMLAACEIELGRREEAEKELEAALALQMSGGDGKSLGPLQSLIANLSGLVKFKLKADRLLDTARQEAGVGGQLDGVHARQLLDELGGAIREHIQPLESSSGPLNVSQINAGGLGAFERLIAGDSEGAIQDIGRSISVVEQWGKGVTVNELRAPFYDRLSGLLAIGVDVSLFAGRPDEAFRRAEEARSRAFIDQIGNQRIDAGRRGDPELVKKERRLRLHITELKRSLREEQQKAIADQSRERLENLQRSLEQVGRDWDELRIQLKATNPEYADIVSVDPLSLEEVQAQVLDGETSLIEYFVSGDESGRVLAWVIDRGHFAMAKLPVTAGDLRIHVAEFRSLIESRQPFRAQAAALYRDLLAPLASHIRHRNVVIVPHGVLHFLPFAALWEEKGRRYLGDTYTLSFSPSATALKFARARTAVPAGPVLIAGDPDGSLPYAAEEARAVARLYGAEPLVGSAATEGAVAARAGEAGILHLAAHATLNPVNPLFTRVELAPDEGHDGSLEMHEVFGLDLSKTGLVVLSACGTQMGRLSAGDEIEGLTRAFLYAGTPAVMASLWNVDDESTALLMERFYTHLRKGKERAEALRRAQAETRRKFPHPYHWAAFVLTGDGR